MVTPFAGIDEMISLVCMQTLADVEVVRANGPGFLAQKEIADDLVFDSRAVVSDEQITYRCVDAPDVRPNEPIVINGVRYRVAGDPRKINAQEFVAQIVRA